MHAEDPLTGERQLATSALLTFVALEADGSKARVPPLRLSSNRSAERSGMRTPGARAAWRARGAGARTGSPW